jgi:hypothetical protein
MDSSIDNLELFQVIGYLQKVGIRLQETIKKLFFGKQSPFVWHFEEDVTFDHGDRGRPALSHTFFKEKKEVSPFSGGCLQLGKLGAEKVGIEYNTIVQARTFLQFPLHPSYLKEETPDPVHIDLPIKHLVVLYYVLTSDGDTIIGDTKITPKQGRAVLFDGSLYHTAEQPKNGLRCVININVI